MLPDFPDLTDYSFGYYRPCARDRRERPKMGFLPPGPKSNAYKSGRRSSAKPKKSPKRA